MAYQIVQLPRDEEGTRAWVERYKTLRLYALKTEPEKFGSTYAREVAWTDEEWCTRLRNPEAVTFVAQQDGKVVGTLTAVQLDCGPDEFVLPGHAWEGPKQVHEGPVPLHFRIYGMYTAPKARGQGIAKALLAAAVKYGKEAALALQRPFIGTLSTEDVNAAAQSLYGKSGFQPIKTVPIVFEGQSRILLILQYFDPPLAAST